MCSTNTTSVKPRKLRRSVRAQIALVGAFALLASGCANSSSGDGDEAVKIGITLPLSGALAASGVAWKQGANMAVKDINADGGLTIDGEKRKVKLLLEDNASEPAQGVSAAKSLITRDKVDLIMTDGFSSSITLATMDIASSLNKVNISGEPMSAEIVEKVQADPKKYSMYWKSNPSTQLYADTVFNFYKDLAAEDKSMPDDKRLTIVAQDDAYAESIVASMQSSFKDAGWKVKKQIVPLGHTDFGSQLTSIKADDPPIVVSVFTAANSGIAFTKQYGQQKLSGHQFGLFYPTIPEYEDAVGNANEGLLTASPFNTISIPAHQEFSEKVRAEYNEPGTYSHANAYDKVMIAAKAIDDAGSLDSKKISKAVSGIDYKGLLHRYVFDPETHEVKTGREYVYFPVSQVQSGKNITIWPTKDAGDSSYKPQDAAGW